VIKAYDKTIKTCVRIKNTKLRSYHCGNKQGGTRENQERISKIIKNIFNR
jgi:hypothetical protein